MPEGARERILARLRGAAGSRSASVSDFSVVAGKCWPRAEPLALLRRNLEAAHAELLESTPATWPSVVLDFLAAAGVRTLLYGPGTPAAAALEAAGAGRLPALVPYDRSIEDLRGMLFGGVDAGFTTCLGGIVETGSLVVVPTAEEPRLLSLVPPIHVVLLDTSRLFSTFWHAISELGLADRMPPNALLISGPSKTADIEQTLAYGVHGPKRLVVVLVDGGSPVTRP